MCGICGVFSAKRDRDSLRQGIALMNQAQACRGPDDEGVFIDPLNGLALGHRRLSIIDLSRAGRGPMGFDNDKLQITFNGEIYNFLELKRDLSAKGYKFRTATDTEIILALYNEYGEKSFSMLRGMFAFGLWDGRGKKLFLVKDRYGIKPLYYYADGEKLIFASTVKALEKSGLVPLTKNPEALIGFLLFGSVPLPATTLKDVLAVPPGHYLVREADGKQKLVQYYKPLNYFLKKEPITNYQLPITKVRSFLEESVKIHLISDAPLGIFLSGGLDSSVVAVLAAQNYRGSTSIMEVEPRKINIENQRLITLSVDFEEKGYSEKFYRDLLLKNIKSEHNEIKIRKQDFFDSFNGIFEAMDQPTVDGVNTFFIAKAAKRIGLKTVLSGLGSDEIFCGYGHFKKIRQLRAVQNLPDLFKVFFGLFSQLGGRYAKLQYLRKKRLIDLYLSIRGLFMPSETARIMDIGVGEVDRYLNVLNEELMLDLLNLKLHPVDFLSYMELKFYLQNQLLKDTDFMSMYHSVEVRVPFLDHHVVEYLSSLDPSFKISKNINKPLLVQGIRDLIPSEILKRKKAGFTFPFEEWLKESISNFQFPISNDILTKFKSGKLHWSRFWSLVVLNQWR